MSWPAKQGKCSPTSNCKCSPSPAPPLLVSAAPLIVFLSVFSLPFGSLFIPWFGIKPYSSSRTKSISSKKKKTQSLVSQRYGCRQGNKEKISLINLLAWLQNKCKLMNSTPTVRFLADFLTACLGHTYFTLTGPPLTVGLNIKKIYSHEALNFKFINSRAGIIWWGWFFKSPLSMRRPFVPIIKILDLNGLHKLDSAYKLYMQSTRRRTFSSRTELCYCSCLYFWWHQIHTFHFLLPFFWELLFNWLFYSRFKKKIFFITKILFFKKIKQQKTDPAETQPSLTGKEQIQTNQKK